jgi:hypothetical protein
MFLLPEGLSGFHLQSSQLQMKKNKTLCELCGLSAAPQGGMQARARDTN